jgi:hypothetical protein
MKQKLFERVGGNTFKLGEIFRDVPGSPLHSGASFLKDLTPIQDKVMRALQKMGMEIYRIIPVKDMVKQGLHRHNVGMLSNVNELDPESIALFLKPTNTTSQWVGVVTADGLVNGKPAAEELRQLSKLNQSGLGPKKAF